jgi:hypothetical protein
VLTLGALLSFAGAVLALWLIHEREIKRMPKEPAEPPDSEAAASHDADHAAVAR